MGDGPDLTTILEAQSSFRVKALLNEHRTDTTDSTAREWLSRWGASGIQPKPPACECSTGRCRICN
ncbi:MAG TPA: hypothetical protein VH817_13810 [Thermoleophilaceae bacterium]